MRRRRKNIFVDRRQATRRRLAKALVLLAVAGVALGWWLLPPMGPTAPISLVETSRPTDSAAPTSPSLTGTLTPPKAETAPPVQPGSKAAAPESSAKATAPAPPEKSVTKDTIKPGETASALLSACLDPAQIHKMAVACDPVYPLSRLRVGQPYAITLDPTGQLERFSYEIDDEETLVVTPGEDGFRVEREPIPYTFETVTVAADIGDNLFAAVARAGEGPELAVRVADIFGWEIDFIRDIRSEDRFSAVVEKRYRDGVFSGYGRILAARFVNQGEPYQGFYFSKGDHTGYYTDSGKNLKKAFLKAPLSFTRVSSGYNLKRRHPILKTVRPHPAIDYAAPRGTPVMAIGSGTVIKAAYQRAAGYYIKIRHLNGYESAYLHLKKGFARGVREGVKVRQGQVIAYVGSTGLSTGPHLDFRMKRHGSYVNPKRITNPRANPLPDDYMPEFAATVADLAPRLAPHVMQAQTGHDVLVGGADGDETATP